MIRCLSSRTQPRRMLFIALGGAVAIACGPSQAGRSAQPADTVAANCTPVTHSGSVGRGDVRRDAGRIAAITPAPVSQRLDTVFYAELIDLNCDGQLDYVGQGIATPAGADQGQLMLVAFVRRDAQWTEVLAAPSPVAGVEMVAVAADLNADNHQDLVTWGADEGGHVPRVFRSGPEGYQPVPVPNVYTLRFEESWSSDCRARTLPALVAANRLRLTRETVSPDALKGHGTDCDLPADTLALQADSLVPLAAGASPE
jgi:hypothetical protein